MNYLFVSVKWNKMVLHVKALGNHIDAGDAAGSYPISSRIIVFFLELLLNDDKKISSKCTSTCGFIYIHRLHINIKIYLWAFIHTKIVSSVQKWLSNLATSKVLHFFCK